MGLDGRYAYLSSADIVDVKTKKIVGQLKDEYGRPMHSEKFLELAFSNGKLLRTVSQFGEGIPSRVKARLAARQLDFEKVTRQGWVLAAAAACVLVWSTTAAAGSDSDLDAVKVVCGRCHTIEVFLNKPRSWERWNDVFADMTKRGASGTDDQLERVTRFFLEKLTLINVNTSQAEELAGVLGVSDEVAQAIMRAVSASLSPTSPNCAQCLG